jgi:flagellar hook assembly protein FlgD
LSYALAQNYPNPFNPQTTISFTLAQRARVRLSIYDVNGALVRTLANEVQPGGAHQVTWDGRNETGQQVASGVYFYQLVTEGFSQTKKMVLLK